MAHPYCDLTTLLPMYAQASDVYEAAQIASKIERAAQELMQLAVQGIAGEMQTAQSLLDLG